VRWSARDDDSGFVGCAVHRFGGIGSLVTAQVSHQKTGRYLVLTGMNPRVRKILEITKVKEFFVTFGSTWEAVEALANTGRPDGPRRMGLSS